MSNGSYPPTCKRWSLAGNIRYLNILLIALVVIAIDLAHYHLNEPGVRPSSFRIGAVTTAIITGVIGAAVLFYLNAASS